MFQPRNRRIAITPMSDADKTAFRWFSSDGDTETGAVWAWGCQELPLTIASHMQGSKQRYIIVSERGMFLKQNGSFSRHGRVKTFGSAEAAALHAEAM